MEITLNVEVRAEKGTKKALSTLRAEYRIPAVVYGGEKAPITVALSEKELMAGRKKGGANAIFRLKHAKGEETVIVKELQRHPVTDRPVHADFQRISLTKKIEAKVPLNLVGESIGVKTNGGMLSIDMRELRIKALPTAIPQHIDVEISTLDLHQIIHVSDLKLPEGVEVIDAADAAVVRCVVAKEIEVAAPVAAVPAEGAAAVAEPESSSTKGKKDEEGKVIAKPGAAPAADAKAAPAKKEGK
ncbi:MAG: 50S ribosomal protein L25 [Elusimicrobiota bacterium]|nr:MAG: 50S ribosomal protein L25 [Elusimicrobiota bacterium]